MKIKRLEINNFRGFQGFHELDFSVDEKKFVTLVVAENGTGKSNLLESITWCLFGKLPTQADKPKFKNDHSDKKDEISVRLTLLDYEKNTYQGHRKFLLLGHKLQC